MSKPADSSVLFRSRVLFVSGKGGTGKTSVAAAIGRLAAAQGRRTLVVEVENQRPSLTAIFGRVPEHDPKEVARNLSITNILWDEALDDWLSDIVSMPRMVRLIMKNKVVVLFLTATPGARDLVMLWRIYQLAQKFDLVVVDMPASGNATAMLSLPVTAKRLFDAGPIRRCAEDLLGFYGRPGTGLVLVGLPEEMVVNETTETCQKIKKELGMLQIPLIILNRTTLPTLDSDERTLLSQLLEQPASDALAAEVLEAGRWEAELERATADALVRLREQPGLPVLALPVLSRGEGPARLVSQLTSALARASSVPVDWVEAG